MPSAASAVSRPFAVRLLAEASYGMVVEGDHTVHNAAFFRLTVTVVAGLIALGAGTLAAQSPAPSTSVRPLPRETGSGSCAKLALAATMPADFIPGGAIDQQFDADCMAWQEFFYLNWRAKPNSVGVPDPAASPSGFGAPARSGSAAYPAVWESYHSADELFPSTAMRLRNAPPSRPGVKVLAATTKFLNAEVHFHGIQQASGGWLTDRYGNLTFYEVRVDNDEYQYIKENGLSGAYAQTACANGPAGFSLPHGAGDARTPPINPKIDKDCKGNQKRGGYGMNFGAIEVKAAWVELPDPRTWPNYKISVADVYPPRAPVRHNVVVGLVGLHIIHKMPSTQQFMWATFEHVDNDPTAGATPAGTYTYYRTNCNPATDHYKCVPNTSPRPCPTIGPCQDPYSAPMQVVRTTSINPFSESITNTAWDLMNKANASSSVYKHYRLVDMFWPASQTVRVPAPRATVPLTAENMAPPNRPVANTTLETYVQNSVCLDCHSFANVATTSSLLRGGTRGPRLIVIGRSPGKRTAAAGSNLASDYSFIFGN